MPHDDKLLALIGQLYDVVLEPHRWPRLMEAISDLFGGVPIQLGQRDPKTAEQGRIIIARTNPEGFRTFTENYRHPGINPLTRSVQALSAGQILRRQAVIDDDMFRRTVVYNELFHPYREIPLITVNVMGDSSMTAYLGIMAKELGKSFGTDEMRVLEQLLPHLQRVLQLEQRLAQSQNLSLASSEALDRLQVGVIVLDTKGEIQSINQRATAIVELADGLVITQHQLKAARSDDTNALHQLIHQAIQTTTAEGLGAGGFLNLPRPSGLRPLQLLITPMTRQAFWAASQPPAALIFVTDPEQEEELPAQMLQRLYGLTNAESEMAILMSQGHGLTYAAEQLRITLNTAKTHQRQIFAKTGVHRQAELVRLLLTSLARIVQP
ncbi:MAG: hypothetical protein ETSY1_31080 [Candidatus Entotheonella factor]|uniref:HTH luxR-type domain-containing protein n=1 Tax=Entotheonella factor TaxID=1429438 RepID=W4LBQ9_ENTF1|nr:MAG: hypothetical protein ETSY1_31080 [Candidatus Entotheonella factor]